VRPATPADSRLAAERADRPYRVPRELVNPLLGQIGGWLDGSVGGRDAGRDTGHAAAGRARRRLITAHGLAPAIVRDPVAMGHASHVDGELPAWLTDEDTRNRRRIERLLEELRAALRALAGTGVPVMPLKGAILATRPGADALRRPMADLDLLVRPADLAAARAALERLGYRRRPDRTRQPTHDTFELPGAAQVVSFDGEHPDNPRPIELHVEVKRHLWGWVDDDDLTPLLWAGATEGTVLGEPAMLPTAAAFLAHLAIHATSDLLRGRGRLIQWLDLVEILGGARTAAGATSSGDPTVEITGLPHPRLAYPALRLAERRLPGRLPPAAAARLESLAALVPTRLAGWATRVPLDSRAGLQAARLASGDESSFEARWLRWAPSRWRLAVAYGDAPPAEAAARHLLRVASVARRPST
jgi:Uncharacterised nucleotidyltransferase